MRGRKATIRVKLKVSPRPTTPSYTGWSATPSYTAWPPPTPGGPSATWMNKNLVALALIGLLVGGLALFFTHAAGPSASNLPANQNQAANPGVGTTDNTTVVSQNNNPPPTSGPSFTNLPYSADWSEGLGAWHTWNNDTNFSALNGEIVSSGDTFGDGATPILAPINLSTADYVLEARIKVDSLVNLGNGASGFGFVLRASDFYDGYVTSVGAYDGVKTKGSHSVYDDSAIASSWEWEANNGISYTPDLKWHTYRVEAQGNHLTFSVDGKTLVQMTDNKFLNPGQVGLWANNYQLEVSSFTVTVLN